jgi:hypothetical protein
MGGEMAGAVTAERYEQLVATGRELVLTISAAQFRLGDLTLEIAPVGSGGPEAPAAFQVETAVQAFAKDVRIAAATLQHYRYVSGRWPADKRVPGICHYVHRIVASVEDEEEPISVLLSPPWPE